MWIPPAYKDLFRPARYKGWWGGRGAARSWSCARALAARASSENLRVLCAREYQSSIADSVHKVVSDQIRRLGLESEFEITRNSIMSRTGSEFIFRGIKMDPEGVKSIEGVDICWVEEAQTISKHSLEVLLPTIRKDGSELWFTWNTGSDKDPVQELLVNHKPKGALVHHVTYRDNPRLPTSLNEERLRLKSLCEEIGDMGDYNHIWEGDPLTLSDAVIFGRRYVVDTFEVPEGNQRFFFGMDFGFANDPSALTRSFIANNELYIDYEAFGHRVEINELPQLMDSIPGVRDWPIKADSSRPETISYLKGKGFHISEAEKWPGSVEDGIAHLKGFNKIHIHERCKHMQDEAKLYRYKVDPKTDEVLPIVVDKHNHGWDSVRYGLDGYIKRSGPLGVWARMAGL